MDKKALRLSTLLALVLILAWPASSLAQSGDQDGFIPQQGNPRAECGYFDLVPVAKYEFDDGVFEFGGDLITFNEDPPNADQGSWTSTVPIGAFLIKQASGSEAIAYWLYFPYVQSDSYDSPFDAYSHMTFCGPEDECEFTDLDEEIIREGKGQIKVTFNNPSGISEIAFTLLNNLQVISNTGGFTEGPAGVWTPPGPPPTSVMFVLERVNTNQSQVSYFVQATAECGSITDFDPLRDLDTKVDRYELKGNYPNPFNPETEIRFTLPEEGAVRLVIYDVMGREVAELVKNELEAGVHSVTWDGTDARGTAVASGLYVYRLEAGTFTQARTMLLLK